MKATLFKVVKTINEKHIPTIKVECDNALTYDDLLPEPFTKDSFEFFEAVDVFEDIPSAIGLRLITNSGTVAFEFKMPYDEERLEVIKRIMFEGCSTFEMTVLIGHDELDWLIINIDDQIVPFINLDRKIHNYGPKGSTDPIHWSTVFHKKRIGSDVILKNLKLVSVGSEDITMFVRMGHKDVHLSNLKINSKKVKGIYSFHLSKYLEYAKRVIALMDKSKRVTSDIISLSQLIGFDTETTLLVDSRNWIHGIKFQINPRQVSDLSSGDVYIDGENFIRDKVLDVLEQPDTSHSRPEPKRNFELTNKAGEVTLTMSTGESLIIHRLENLLQSGEIGYRFLARCICSGSQGVEVRNHVLEMDHDNIGKLHRNIAKNNFSYIKVTDGKITDLSFILELYLDKVAVDPNTNFDVVKKNFMVDSVKSTNVSRERDFDRHTFNGISDIKFNLIKIPGDGEVYVNVNFLRTVGEYSRYHQCYSTFNCILRVDQKDLPFDDITYNDAMEQCLKVGLNRFPVKQRADAKSNRVLPGYVDVQNPKTLVLDSFELISLSDTEGFELVDWYLNKIHENWANRKGNKG